MTEPITSREELDALLEKARIFMEKQTPEERASMLAVQALGWTVSELVMTIFEEGAPAVDVRVRLGMIRAQVEAKMGTFIAHIVKLSDTDRAYVLANIDKAIAEVDEHITDAA